MRAGLSAQRVSRRLGVKAQTLRRYIRKGALFALFVKGRWRFDRVEVELFARWGPPVMSVGQVARALRCHPNSVLNWTRAGALNVHAIGSGGRRLYRREEVMSFPRRGRRRRQKHCHL